MPFAHVDVEEANAHNASGSTIGTQRLIVVWSGCPATLVLVLILHLRSLDLPSGGSLARFGCLHPEQRMRTSTAVIECDQETTLYVGYVPGWAGAHSQGASLDELRATLDAVVAMLLEDGEPAFSAGFFGTQTLEVA